MVLPPTFQVVEFDNSAALSGTWTGFVNTTSRALDFGQIDNSQSGVISSTKVVAMSGVEFNGNTAINDMKFYLMAYSAIDQGDVQYLQSITNTWVQGKVLTLADTNTPTSLPASQNYFALGGGSTIQGSGQGDGLGQWVYLGVYIGSDVPDNTYGGLGQGTFRYRFRFDYY